MAFRIEYQTKGSDFIDFPYGSPFPIIIMMGDAGNNPERVLLKMEYSPLTTGVIPKSVKGLILPLSLFKPYGISMTCLFICDYASDIPFQQVSVDEGEKEFNFSINSNSSSNSIDPSNNASSFIFPQFLPSGKIVAQTAGTITAHPFIIKTSQGYYMYAWNSTPLRTISSVSPSLEGPWQPFIDVPGLNGCHKFALLVDEYNSPVLLNNLYHGYGVTNVPAPNKRIKHFTSTSLDGPWQPDAGFVMPLGVSGTMDSYHTDAPFVCYDYKSNEILMWYQGFPSTSLPVTGFNSTVLFATCKPTTPEGPFVKTYQTPVPRSTIAGNWNSQWQGGIQIRKYGNFYAMLYVASITSATLGSEPNPYNFGVAYSTSLKGPWNSYMNNPVVYSGPVGDVVGNANNVSRPFLCYDESFGRDYIFFSAGSSSELITFYSSKSYNYCPASFLSFVPPSPYPTMHSLPGAYIVLYSPGKYQLSFNVNVSWGSAPTASDTKNIYFDIISSSSNGLSDYKSSLTLDGAVRSVINYTVTSIVTVLTPGATAFNLRFSAANITANPQFGLNQLHIVTIK